MPTSTHEEKEAPTDEDETSQCRDASQTWDDMCAAYEQHIRDNLENEFSAEMFNYLQMLFKEYQEGATPCVSREQAEQLQRLLRIPRTSMDIKRRKKIRRMVVLDNSLL